MNSRSKVRKDTNEFVYGAEEPVQKKRRERKEILKTEFRKIAERAATRVFGDKSPQTDIIREKGNCTEAIIDGVEKLSRRAQFDEMLEIFLEEIELESGKLENADSIAGKLVMVNGLQKNELIACVIELLMATEDEKLITDFLDKLTRVELLMSVRTVEGMNKLAGIEHIHTMTELARSFIEKPEETTALTERIVARIGRTNNPENEILYSDIVTAQVVKNQV